MTSISVCVYCVMPCSNKSIIKLNVQIILLSPPGQIVSYKDTVCREFLSFLVITRSVIGFSLESHSIQTFEERFDNVNKVIDVSSNPSV